MLGYLIPCEIVQPQKFQLPYYLGSLLDAKNYFDPKDPILKQIKGLTSVASGLSVCFKLGIGRCVLLFSPKLLEQFLCLWNATKGPADGRDAPRPALRDALPVLAKLLRHARPLPPKWRVLIPQRYLKNEQVQFWQSRSWFFVVNKSLEVIDIYDVRGRNLFSFIEAEVADLRRRSKSRRVGALDLRVQKRSYCGVLKLGRDIYFLPFKSLKSFIEQVAFYKKERESLPPLYTVQDCLYRFGALFQNSSPKPSATTSQGARKKSNRQTSSRLHAGWEFVINNKRVIIDCFNKR